MIKLFEKQKNNIYIITLFVNFILMDFVIRNIFFKYAFMGLYNKITYAFVLGWSLVLTGICCVIPGKMKKIVSIFLVVIFSVLMIVHNAYDNVFQKFFFSIRFLINK